jgi:hypothetical protein
MGGLIEGVMGMVFGKQPKMPKLPEAEPAPDLDEASAKASEEQRKRRRSGQKEGRASTLLSSPIGEAGESSLAKQKLLGGS